MLSARDFNAQPTPSTPSAKGAVVKISGSDLINLLRPCTSKGVGGADAATAALRIESRHEIVALLPQSRVLTLNFANWNRMKGAGNIDEPTLVMSFLGAGPRLPRRRSHRLPRHHCLRSQMSSR